MHSGCAFESFFRFTLGAFLDDRISSKRLQKA
jgi:hypothetical protein